MLNENISKCEHIKTNGVRCGSPALRDGNFCYFHDRTRRDFPHRAEAVRVAPGSSPAGPSSGGTPLDIPFPEDADAIQYGLGKVIYGLLNGTIDRKTAGLVLYALQTASANLKSTSLLKRSQRADEEERSNVSPLLAYYLGPSREDYGRMLRILQDAEADLQNKTREIAELKQRLGEPCEEEATTDAASGQSGWVERMHEATATEPREEHYPRHENIHSAYAARRSAGPGVPIADRRWAEPAGSSTQKGVVQASSDAPVHDSTAASTDSPERSAKALVIHAEAEQRIARSLHSPHDGAPFKPGFGLSGDVCAHRETTIVSSSIASRRCCEPIPRHPCMSVPSSVLLQTVVSCCPQILCS